MLILSISIKISSIWALLIHKADLTVLLCIHNIFFVLAIDLCILPWNLELIRFWLMGRYLKSIFTFIWLIINAEIRMSCIIWPVKKLAHNRSVVDWKRHKNKRRFSGCLYYFDSPWNLDFMKLLEGILVFDQTNYSWLACTIFFSDYLFELMDYWLKDRWAAC